MIDALFLTASYYLGQCMGRMRGAEHHLRYVEYLVFIMTVGFLVFITPHTIVMTPAELKAMGRQQHLMLGNFGVMSAENGGIDVVIVTTILSFTRYQRGNKIPPVSWAKFGNIFMRVVPPRPRQHHRARRVGLLHSGQRPRWSFCSASGNCPVLLVSDDARQSRHAEKRGAG